MNDRLPDDTDTDGLFPFTSTRSAPDIRVGILTIREKWQYCNPGAEITNHPDNIIPARQLPQNSARPSVSVSIPEKSLLYPWQIFQFNDEEIRTDYELITAGRTSFPLSPTNRCVNPEHIFLEEGARVEYAFLNASAGPIYIGKNGEIMEGSMIRGPFALCEGATVKMGAKIYGATTVGPYSMVGGEIKNSVILGFSNKAHDGYLGDAVIGEWCNLGAGTSCSNVKNNANEVGVWNKYRNQYVIAGSKCGLIMGDYSRCAINTSFDTATVVGICCNVFGDGLTPKYIPSFSWGCGQVKKYEFEKAVADIGRWKKLKNQALSDAEIKTLKHIFDQSLIPNK